ncbi:unnamed protein product [Cylicostephanus goldi]|uniref:Uncharacterized protein n=1 Tax=Cylicostephanus goldi TaxID=71465 RepID=A0A3P6RI14_CYLGO|nr:unnamed protein product [Cylicostephanus goldi]
MRMVAVLLMLILFGFIQGKATTPKEYNLDGKEKLPPYDSLKKPRDPFRRRGFYDPVEYYEEEEQMPSEAELVEKKFLVKREAYKGESEDDEA